MAHSGHSAPVVAPAGGSSLLFRAGTLLCALPLAEVVETMRPLPVSPLSGAPAFLLGICIIRGVPTPVVDVARLLGGEQAGTARFVVLSTERGPVAFATGEVLGIRDTPADDRASGHATLLCGTPACRRFVAGVATIGAEPVLLLRSMRVVPAEIWATVADEAVPA